MKSKSIGSRSIGSEPAGNQEFDVAGHPLATGKVSGLLLKFAIPSIISMLVGALYNIVDQVFIGHSVGILGNAATNVAFPLVTICMSLSLLLGIGGASNFNLELGKGNPERAGRIVANAITYAVTIGVVLCAVVLLLLRPLLRSFGATDEVFSHAVTYTSITSLGMPFLIVSACGSHLIRADGSPTYSMLCNLTGALLNTVLDPLFIFGFGMGIAGAAWATTLSQAVSCAMAVRHLMRFRSVPLARDYFRPRLSELKAIASLGSSACFNQLSMMCVQIAMNNTLTRYGASSIYGSNVPLAAVGVITKVNMIFFSTVIGIAQGGQPIIGFNYGAGNYARVEKTFWLISSCGTAVSIVSFLCFQLFPRQIISLFGSGSEEYYLFADRFFRIFLLMTFTSGILPSTATFFTSIGKAMRGFLVALTKQILFLLPLILIFPRFWGIDGVMYAGPVADSAAAILAAVLITTELRRMRKIDPAAPRT
ncbi:MAG: MATE family efflux transporter [Synergistaceae bacterium]|jgi:Na+-driven multidrug efflux pump|nr:MATE family efflux transporter [Synergistaceae bacterium]